MGYVFYVVEKKCVFTTNVNKINIQETNGTKSPMGGNILFGSTREKLSLVSGNGGLENVPSGSSVVVGLIRF